MPLLPARQSSAWGLSDSPSVMPSTVAPCSPVELPTLGKNVPTTCSLGSRSAKAVVPSIWISGIPPPSSEHASSLDIDLGTFGGHSWRSTQCTAATPPPPGVRRIKSRACCRLIIGSLDWNWGNPKTKSWAHMGTTGTSDSWTGDKCSIYWTMNAVFRLSHAWAFAWPLRPRVVTYAGWSGRPSRFRSLGDIKMFIVPQSINACMRCISPLPTLIERLWIIWAVSGLDVPHTYWLDMRASGLSNTTLDFEVIWCCSMLFKVAMNVCVTNHSKQNSASSKVSCQTRWQERPMSFFAVEYQRSSVVWICVLCPSLQIVCGPAEVGYLQVKI